MVYQEVIHFFDYSLLINLERRTIEVYNPVCGEEISKELPLGISWENIESVLSPDPDKPAFLRKVMEMDKESLIKKLKDFYFRGK